MYKFAINRPISTLMLFLSAVVFGLFSISSMSINLFPDVEIPLVKVTTYANGDKDYINNKITKKLEDELSSIDGIKNLSSFSYNNLSIILIEFKLDKNIEIALNDARDKINKTNLSVKSVVEKISGNDEPIFSLFISANDNNTTSLMQAIDQKAQTFLQRISGVSTVKKVGFLSPQVNVLLDPNALNNINLTADEIGNLIKLQNLQIPLGKIENKNSQTVLSSNFDAKNLEDIKNIRIKDGIFLSDLAKIDFSHEQTNSIAFMDGKSGVMLEVIKLAKANTLETIKNLRDNLANLQSILGDNFNIKVAFDKSEVVEKHINQVSFDMVLGVFLTAIIVFVFLRDFKATIIASIAIPISIISTFFIINLLGYDINRLTLIALTLGIGVFVDDAIVVIENISKKMQEGEKNPLFASLNGVKEISFSILAISAVLLCVFIPIAFMDGIVGRYFNSFAMSVASGVVISFFVCVMLIPSLCARFSNSNFTTFYKKTEFIFNALDNGYKQILDLILKFKVLFIFISFSIFIFCLFLGKSIGTDFLPNEDNNEFNIFIKGDPSISIEAMSEKTKPILEIIKNDKRVDDAYLLIGYDDAKQAYKAKIYTHLVSLKDRTDRQKEIMIEYRKKLKFEDLEVTVTDLPIVNAGDNAPVQLVITGESIQKLDEIYEKVKKLLNEYGGIVDINTKNDDKADEIKVSIDKIKAKKLNINEFSIANTINSSLSQNTVSIFDDGTKQYDIVVYFDKKFRQNLENLKNIKIKNATNESFMLGDIASFVAKKEILLIPRFNKENELRVLANIDGVALGDVSKFIDQKMPEILPSGYKHQFVGFIELMDDTNKAFLFTIIFSAILIYMILASLYESFLLPFVIMLSLPLAFAGVIVGLFLSDNSFSLFVMIGSILLFGMVGKNAILLIDFANKFAKDGLSPDEAVKEAGVKRLHAILMTSFAMIFAMLPLAVSTGAGYEGNSPMATAIIFGLLSSTILTLLVVPALFGVVYKLDLKLKKFYEKDLI